MQLAQIIAQFFNWGFDFNLRVHALVAIDCFIFVLLLRVLLVIAFFAPLFLQLEQVLVEAVGKLGLQVFSTLRQQLQSLDLLRQLLLPLF